MPRLFDKPASMTQDSYTPGSPGILTALGKAFSGVSAPYLGDFQFAAREADLQRQQQLADLEFQKYLKDKQPGILEQAILLSNPDIAKSLGIGGEIQAPTNIPEYSVGNEPPMSLAIEGMDLGPINLKNINLEGQKAVAKEKATAKFQSDKGLKKSSRFIKRFSETYDEITRFFPKSGESSVQGLISRVGAGAYEKAGVLPKTKAFLRQQKVYANEQARTVEGGRVTDQDRQVYADAMANALSAPSETNTILVADSILNMSDKGGDIKPLLEDLSSLDNPLLNSIVVEILNNLPVEERNKLRGSK